MSDFLAALMGDMLDYDDDDFDTPVEKTPEENAEDVRADLASAREFVAENPLPDELCEQIDAIVADTKAGGATEAQTAIFVVRASIPSFLVPDEIWAGLLAYFDSTPSE